MNNFTSFFMKIEISPRYRNLHSLIIGQFSFEKHCIPCLHLLLKFHGLLYCLSSTSNHFMHYCLILYFIMIYCFEFDYFVINPLSA